MLLPNHLLLLILVSVPVLVDSRSPVFENRQNPTLPRKPCPKGSQPRGGDQDTIFPNCDFGVDINENIGVRIGRRNSTLNLDVENNPDINSLQANAIIHGTKPNQTPYTNTTGQEPIRQPGCLTIPDPGECRGAFPRFYYNQNNDQCDCFLFGGCDEELVVYTWLTFQECLTTCVPGNTSKGPRCQQVSTLEQVQRFLSSSDNPVNNSRNDVIAAENNTGYADVSSPRMLRARNINVSSPRMLRTRNFREG